MTGPCWKTRPAGKNRLPSGDKYSLVFGVETSFRKQFRERRVSELLRVELILELAVVPVVARQQSQGVRMRLAFLRREHSDLE